MRLSLILTAACLIMSSGIFVGCDGDDDNPAASGSVPEFFVDGLIVVNPRVGLSMRLRPYGGAPFPEVDSVTLEDTLCSLNRSQYWGWGDYVYYAGFDEFPTADPMFDRGDVVRVTVHSGSRSGFCTIKLLDINLDSIGIVNPGKDTTVPVGQRRLVCGTDRKELGLGGNAGGNATLRNHTGHCLVGAGDIFRCRCNILVCPDHSDDGPQSLVVSRKLVRRPCCRLAVQLGRV